MGQHPREGTFRQTSHRTDLHQQIEDLAELIDLVQFAGKEVADRGEKLHIALAKLHRLIDRK